MPRENEVHISELELAQLCLYVNYENQTLPNGWSRIESFDHTWYGERDRNNRYRYVGFQKGADVVCVFSGNDLTKDSQLLKKDELHSYFQDGCVQIERNSFLPQKLNQHNNIIFTGYSTGAALAEIAACFYGAKTITFESPGCSEFLAERAKNVTTYRDNYNNEYFDKVTTILTRPNGVNTLNKHFGKIVRLRLKHVESTSWWHVAKSIGGEADRALTFVSLGTWAWGMFGAKAAASAVVAPAAKVVTTSTVSATAPAANIAVTEAAKALTTAEANLTSYVLANGWRKLFNNKLYWKDVNKLKAAIKKAQEIYDAAKATLAASNTVTTVVTTSTPATAAVTAANTTTAGASLVNKAVVSASSATVLRALVPLSKGKNEELINYYQHGLNRIIDGLIQGQNPTCEAGGPGTTKEMESWPDTMVDSWSKFALDVARSKLPFQTYNAGIMNINDEDAYEEANIEIMDGYAAKSARP